MKRFSITLGLISLIVAVGLGLFGSKVYSKLNESEYTVTKIDSIKIIQSKDSIINRLLNENDSLKVKIKDNRDTIIVVKNKIDTVQIDTMTR